MYERLKDEYKQKLDKEAEQYPTLVKSIEKYLEQSHTLYDFPYGSMHDLYHICKNERSFNYLEASELFEQV